MVILSIIGILYLFCDVFYWLKWIPSILALWIWRFKHRRRFDLYDFGSENDPVKLNILVPKEEKIFESPCSEEHLLNFADEICMYGVNSSSERVMVRVARAPNEEAEAWVYLKLADGRRYQLQERGYQRNFGGKCTGFSCGGLQMHYLTPMRKWRIVYCGMLKEITKEKEEKEVFVKFSFLWTASSDVFDASQDIDIRAAADAMANVRWDSYSPPMNRFLEELNFYCQSGVMSGVVSLEDESDIEMYLFGEKIRNMGKHSEGGPQFKHIVGAIPKSGLIVHLGKATPPHNFKNLPFGFLVHPSSELHIIEDGNISAVANANGNVEELTATFKAGTEYELRGRFVEEGVRFTGESGWNGQPQIAAIEFTIGGLEGSGFLIQGEIQNISQNRSKKLVPQLPDISAKPLTVYFSDEISQNTELSGGKGSSLGVLTKLQSQLKSKFVVPKGIIVTTAAFEKFLNPDIIDKIENLKDIAYGNTPGKIKEACKIVASTVEKSYLPDVITKEIEEKLKKLFDNKINHHKVAVRSSATGEDTDQMSAAGQMDTFLGVQGLKEIFTAVKKCWASQFGYIAVEYKRQNGQILNSPMAVVIQEMVDCEAAGVLFTCDPVTNNPSVTVITGNYGLGESVVSGSEEPDTIVLKKFPENDIEIKSVTVGLKQHKIVMTEESPNEEINTVVTEDIPDEKRNQCCISTEMALKLGKLAMKIEDYFKSPRDIEWGIKQDVIYILQSRPITTGAAITDYEIKHEFDGPLRTEDEFYSVCNVGEVMPGATSPLGLEIIARYFTVVFQKETRRHNKKLAMYQQKYCSMGLVPFYNHISMQVVNFMIRGGKSSSIFAQSMMIGLFGRILKYPDMEIQAEYRRKGRRGKDERSFVRLLKNQFFGGHGIDQLKKKTFSYESPALKGQTSQEIFELLLNSCDHIWNPFQKHIVCTTSSSLWNMIVFAVLGKARGSIDTVVYSDFSKLLSTSTNVESADVPSALQGLANEIAKNVEIEKFKSMSVEDADNWLKTSTTLAGYKFRQFIQRHGHRCLKEFDLRSSPWAQDPKPLIKLLQNMVGSCEEVKEKTEEDFSKLESQLAVPLSFKTKLLLRFLLPNCRRAVREREACKSILIKSLDNTRKGYQHLSKMMVAEGYLPDPDLLFFLTLEEIRDLLHSRNPKTIARANHRRKLYPTLEGFRFPEIWKGNVTPINENQDQEVEYIADLTMKGIPVSQGCVRGFARVALTLEEASHLKPGEILITYSTDIGWSPYFPILAGVVTELGGLISHGAVVSREYGLPCIVGLHGATKQFITGDFVLLDGNKGILQRLTPPEE